MARVIARHLVKTYAPGVTPVNDISFEVPDKGFLTLLGPSGCGKSTILRMIAGLESITAGEIVIGDRVVNRLPPAQRDIAMVFQSYALYPHMTVYENIAVNLQLKKVPRDQIEQRVRETARLLDIEPLLNRRPRELSGGQRQRVALGRAIIRRPAVFLLDEPLSNLDAILREKMRSELKALFTDLGATVIYVTHDQTEAMTMSSQVAVMNAGVIQQFGTPEEIYREPANIFVASFVGSPRISILNATLRDEGLFIGAQRVPLPPQRLAPLAGRRQVLLGIRPENVHVSGAAPPADQPSVCGRRRLIEPLGAFSVLELDVEGQSLSALIDPQQRIDQRVAVTFDPQRMLFFDPETQQRIMG